MKNRLSVFRMPLAAITAAAVYLGGPWSTTCAQNTSTTNDSANTLSAARATTPPEASAAQSPDLPYGVKEVVKMYRGGINKDVIVSYINNTPLPYHLGADGILYLQSLGIPQEITKAITQRDGALQQQPATQQQYYQQQPVPAPAPAPNGTVAVQSPVQVVTPSTPPPDITVIGSDDGYGYPYYDYGDSLSSG